MKKAIATLDIVQATALSRLAEKRVEELKKDGTELQPGTYGFDFNINVEGRLSRGEDTEVTPQFRMDSLYKALVLRYAEQMENPQEWLTSLLAIDGALGAVVQLGSDTVLKSVDADLIALYDKAVEQAKKKFQAISKKQPRAGSTTVVGAIEPISLPSKKK